MIVVKTSDGRKKVIGDGGGFTRAEMEALQGLAPSTREPFKFTEQEQAELDAVEDRLQRASDLFNTLWDESASCGKKIEEICQGTVDPWGNSNRDFAAASADDLQGLKDQAHEIRARMSAAREIEHDALVARNTVRRRITAAATARQFPIQYHTPRCSIDDRLADAEKRR